MLVAQWGKKPKQLKIGTVQMQKNVPVLEKIPQSLISPFLVG